MNHFGNLETVEGGAGGMRCIVPEVLKRIEIKILVFGCVLIHSCHSQDKNVSAHNQNERHYSGIWLDFEK